MCNIIIYCNNILYVANNLSFKVKKAKTHYTNYRNQGVNPHDFSRNLHREWFELIQFPTSREIESLGKHNLYNTAYII